jgi:hypothetical protein
MGRRLFEAVMGVILIIVAIVLAFLFQQSYARGVELQSFPVPLAGIPPYTMLSEEMFEWKDFPRALGGGYTTSLDQLTGRISNSFIPPGLPIPLVLVTSAGDFRMADPKLEILSIPVSPESAVGGQVRIGERINIYRLIPPPDLESLTGPESLGKGNVTLVAEEVLLTNVLGKGGAAEKASSTSREVVTAILVLAVTDEQRDAILKLLAETEQGAIMWISLAPITQ